MATTQQPPTPPAASAGAPCANCGAPLAADQRYCLSCGTRRGEPRAPERPAPTEQAPAPQAARPADVSPLAAVIGIALLGGMLLIGVLIGRESGDDEPAPAPVVQVEPTTDETTGAPGAGDGEAGAAGEVTSEWPAGTDGFTIQVSALPKSGATPESVDDAKQAAVADGATDAAVLDSDLYPTLPPGQYLIYSGVYTDRKSAEVALRSLDKSVEGAIVVEVSSAGGAAESEPAPDQSGAVAPGAAEEEAPLPPTPEAEK